MIALFADIHSNLPALEAVLTDMPKVSQIWVLGDTVGELPYPREALDRLEALSKTVKIEFIAGNKEISQWKPEMGSTGTGGRERNSD